jgi:methylase of polypeptide subunit release factors
VIVSNPPYVAVGSSDLDPSVGDWEPSNALFAGTDGLDDIRTIAAGAPDRLRPGGVLVLEIGADQGPPSTTSCAERVSSTSRCAPTSAAATASPSPVAPPEPATDRQPKRTAT